MTYLDSKTTELINTPIITNKLQKEKLKKYLKTLKKMSERLEEDRNEYF